MKRNGGGSQAIEIVDVEYSMKIDNALNCYVKKNNGGQYRMFGKCPYGLSKEAKYVFLQDVMMEFKENLNNNGG